MAKKPFSVSDYIKPEDVSKLDTEATAISFIPLERLLQNEKNFYDTSSIDELADSIALNGLIEPIIVRPVRDGSGDYRIISGHRRFLAICELAKDEPERWARVPAIIREPASDVLEELLLIEANRATRVMSSADTMRQAERYRELLAELKRQGVEIPGRLRDAVAEAMQISASRLARLDVIRKNLSPEWMEAFETGSLSESAAYELARLPQEQQASVRSKAKGNPTAQSVAAIVSELSREADASAGQSHATTSSREDPEADKSSACLIGDKKSFLRGGDILLMHAQKQVSQLVRSPMPFVSPRKIYSASCPEGQAAWGIYAHLKAVLLKICWNCRN